MQIVDTNVLVYAVDDESPDNAAARAWLDGALADAEAVGFTWLVLVGFLRVSTQAGLFHRPLSVEKAADAVDGWLAQAPAVIVEPTVRHSGLMRRLLAEVGTAGNLVNDAHIAALALEHGGEVVSFDRDFARFEGVRWRLPG